MRSEKYHLRRVVSGRNLIFVNMWLEFVTVGKGEGEEK